MPIFEYHCNKCKQSFEVMRLSRNGFKNIHCPECESADVTKDMSTFAPAVAVSPACGDAASSCPAPKMPGCGSGTCGMMG